MATTVSGLALRSALLACVLLPGQAACQEVVGRADQSSLLLLHAYVVPLESDDAITNIKELEHCLDSATEEAVEDFAIPCLMRHAIRLLAEKKRKQVEAELESLGWIWNEYGVAASESRGAATDADLQALADTLHPHTPATLVLPAKSPVTDEGLAPLLQTRFTPLVNLTAPFSNIGDDSLGRLVRNLENRTGKTFLRDLQLALRPDQQLWLVLTRAGEQPSLEKDWERTLGMQKLSVTKACGWGSNEVPLAVDAVLQQAKRDPRRIPQVFSVESPNVLGYAIVTNTHSSVPDSWPTQGLILPGTAVTDVGLRALAQLDSVIKLDLSYTKVTDAGIEALEGLKLERLSLCGTSITDASIDTLLQVQSLKFLDIRNTAVTVEGVARLSKASSLKALGVGGPNLSIEQAITVYESIPGLEAIGLHMPAHTLDPTLLAQRLPAFFPHQESRQHHLLARPTSRIINGGEADNFTHVQALAISKDEQQLSVLTTSSGPVGNPWAVHRVDLKTGDITRVEFPDSETPDRSKRPCFSPDGSLLAAMYFTPTEGQPSRDAAPTQTLHVWRLPKKGETKATLVGSRKTLEMTRPLGFTADNQRLAVNSEGILQVLKAGTQLKVVDKWPKDSRQKANLLSPLAEFVVSPSGRFIAGVNLQEGLLLIDLQEETAKAILAGEPHPTSLDIRSGSEFYGRMRVSADHLKTRDNTYSFNPDESKLYANIQIARGTGLMVIYDLTTNRITASLEGGLAAVSPAGDWCITSDGNNTYHWNLRGAAPVEFAFVPGGSRANSIVLSEGKTVSAWAGKEGLRIDIRELGE